MTAQDYYRWTKPLRNHPALTNALLLSNSIATKLVYILYPILLVWLLYRQEISFWRVLLTPAISFLLVSIFRHYYNAPRPYEQLNIQPLIHKDTTGHSFPSRHVFSVSVISCAFLYTIPWIGVVLLVLSVFMAMIRVLGGVHFPVDVLAGFLCGMISGLIGFVLL